VKPGGKVVIDLKTGGSIKIEGWDKDLVSARVIINKEDEDNPVEVEFNQNGNEIGITSDYREHHSHHQSSNTQSILNCKGIHFFQGVGTAYQSERGANRLFSQVSGKF